MERKARVLVVEDDADDAFFVRRAFQECCVQVDLYVVGDGDSAVAWLSGEGAYADRAVFPLPDHVLLDLKLPRRSGLEVLRWIRAEPAFRSLPVTILSGSELLADVSEATRLGVDGYIRKHVSFRAFLESVRGFCRRFEAGG